MLETVPQKQPEFERALTVAKHEGEADRLARTSTGEKHHVRIAPHRSKKAKLTKKILVD